MGEDKAWLLEKTPKGRETAFTVAPHGRRALGLGAPAKITCAPEKEAEKERWGRFGRAAQIQVRFLLPGRAAWASHS